MKTTYIIAIIIATLFITYSSADNTDSVVWNYGEWDTSTCYQTQCGYALSDRVVQCLQTSPTIEPTDDARCLAKHGKPVKTMECIYTPTDVTKLCGGNAGRKAYTCEYNPNFVEEDPASQYMTCKCINGYTGESCQIAPPNPPKPDPEPDDGDDDEKDSKFLTWKKVGFIILILLIIVVIAAVTVFIINKRRKAKNSTNNSVNASNGDGTYINMDQQNTIYA